ncbi:MAG: outer membrane lipoprotein carrier protein LolA, partial [Candidatus Sumerlaeia bacterium]|nr:outer membrane lipoprotein carrier protein LolA [Candidatus Sumerlaeia bacterium]
MKQLLLTNISALLIWCLALPGFAQFTTTPTLVAKNSDIIASTGNRKSDTGITSPTLHLQAEPEALTFLSKLETKYKQIEMISGEFKQLKRSTLFLEEISSQGRFYFKKPGKFRCDYLPPNESVNIIVDNTAWIYVPEIKQVEKYYLGKSSSKACLLYTS